MRRSTVAIAFLFIFGAAAAILPGRFGVPPLPFAIGDAETTAATDGAAAPGTDKPAAPLSAADQIAALADLATKSEATHEGTGTSIDISRISPDGTSVFAGRAEPNTYVTILEAEKPVATAKADANGDWSVATEHKFASADPAISYTTSHEPPAPAEKVAALEPGGRKSATDAAAGNAPAANAAAAEVMSKFEKLVAEAREEAKQSAESGANPPSAAAAPASAPSPSAATPTAPAASSSAATEPVEPGDARPAASAAPPSRQAAAATGSTAAAPQSAKAEAPAIPVPIMFEYNEATFTDEGRRAADLLLEYLTLKRAGAVTLSGHADERGSGPYNMELSAERLQAVSRLLRNGGWKGDLDLLPKGKTEPYAGVDRTKLPEDALYQLDRRVELRLIR